MNKNFGQALAHGFLQFKRHDMRSLQGLREGFYNRVSMRIWWRYM
jgi:hypothetical protein